jgi:hypothetical protein
VWGGGIVGAIRREGGRSVLTAADLALGVDQLFGLEEEVVPPPARASRAVCVTAQTRHLANDGSGGRGREGGGGRVAWVGGGAGHSSSFAPGGGEQVPYIHALDAELVRHLVLQTNSERMGCCKVGRADGRWGH